MEYSVSPASDADLVFHELVQGRGNNRSAKHPPSGKQLMSKLRRRKEKARLKSSASRVPLEDEVEEEEVSPWELVNMALQGQEEAAAVELTATSSDDDDDCERVLTDSYSKSAALTATTLSFADDLRRKSASLVRALSEQRECGAQLAALQELLQRDTGDLGYQRDWSKVENAREEFLAAATMYGKIIIAELPMKNAHRTIRENPLLGGLIGGAKYLFHGMLVKYAPDNAKAPGHELKSLREMGDDFVRPLIVKMHYRGHTISIQSVLPITRETLVHGSCDGGRTRRRDGAVEEALRPVLARLGLAKICFDGEFHRTPDGRLCCVDLHRMAPAVEDDETRLQALYRFEFLRHYAAQRPPLPLLRSDQPRSPAAQALLRVRVAEFEARPAFGADLVAEMHAWGLNVRLLARLWRHPREGPRVLREMAARLAKHELWARQRQVRLVCVGVLFVDGRGAGGAGAELDARLQRGGGGGAGSAGRRELLARGSVTAARVCRRGGAARGGRAGGRGGARGHGGPPVRAGRHHAPAGRRGRVRREGQDHVKTTRV